LRRASHELLWVGLVPNVLLLTLLDRPRCRRVATEMNLVLIERAAKPSAKIRAPFTEGGATRLFVQPDSLPRRWRDSMAVLFRLAPRPSRSAQYFFRGTNFGAGHVAGQPIGASLLLHCLLVALVVYLPRAIPVKASPGVSRATSTPKIYYRVPLLASPDLPRIAPAGPGGKPGSGFLPRQVPVLGSSAEHSAMTIVSKLVHPDNFRQTIYQPSTPPDLKILGYQKVPNIVLGHGFDPLKVPLSPNNSRPTEAKRQISAVLAPSLSANAGSPSALTTLIKLPDSESRLLLPPPGGGAPIERSNLRTGASSGLSSGDSADLVALGVDPADSTDRFSLPTGNRSGEFTIARPAGGEGSPGGDPQGAAGGGSGGGNHGGDGSTGLGPDGRGGGGRNSGGSGSISIAGGSAGRDPSVLDPSLALRMVYPVAAPPLNVRRNTLVISAGPIGGGALNVYGVLDCGKIYSVFLPMPGSSWTMQYCDKSTLAGKPQAGRRAEVVRLEMPLAPPDVDLTHRFDFKRVTVPPEKSHRMIVLKGTIAADGAVEHVVVYQGVVPEMDEAARIAFSRWRFKPAMRDGKPLEVEFLVGIPPVAGRDHINR
jgi:Gram-negative bacterial TonB protein C-terminal